MLLTYNAFFLGQYWISLSFYKQHTSLLKSAMVSLCLILKETKMALTACPASPSSPFSPLSPGNPIPPGMPSVPGSPWGPLSPWVGYESLSSHDTTKVGGGFDTMEFVTVLFHPMNTAHFYLPVVLCRFQHPWVAADGQLAVWAKACAQPMAIQRIPSR